MGVFFLFLLALALGSATTFFWIPEEDLGRGYFQTNALVVIGLLTLAAAVLLLHPFLPFGDSGQAGGGAVLLSLGASFLYYAAIWKRRWRLGRWAAGLLTAASLAALWLAGAGLTPSAAGELPARGALLGLALVTSALVLGWSLITMLLGHWYLVAPGLTFRYLVRFCWVVLLTVVLRLLASAASVAAAAQVDPLLSPHPLSILTGFGGQGMFFWFRLLWGLAGPLLLALMSLHCARHRSNQSATGILYVLVVGVLIGEVTAYYLLLTTGVPV